MKLMKDSLVFICNTEKNFENCLVPGMTEDDRDHIRTLTKETNAHSYHVTRHHDYFWARKWLSEWCKMRPFNLLDIGGGQSAFVFYVKEKFPEVSAHLIDVKANMFHSTNPGRTDLSIWDSAIFTGYAPGVVQDSIYDVVTAMSSIEHFGAVDYPALFKSIEQILKPGGLFLLTTDVSAEVQREELWRRGYENFSISGLVLKCLSMPEEESNHIIDKAEKADIHGERNFIFAAFIKE